MCPASACDFNVGRVSGHLGQIKTIASAYANSKLALVHSNDLNIQYIGFKLNYPKTKVTNFPKGNLLVS